MSKDRYIVLKNEVLYECSSYSVKDLLKECEENEVVNIKKIAQDTFALYENGQSKKNIVKDKEELIEFFAKKESDAIFVVKGISYEEANVIFNKIVKTRKELKEKNKNIYLDSVPKVYVANDLLVVEFVCGEEGECKKYIVEKIENTYKDVITGKMIDLKSKSFSKLDLKLLTDYFPKMQDKEVPELVLMWAFETINGSKNKLKDSRVIGKL